MTINDPPKVDELKDCHFKVVDNTMLQCYNVNSLQWDIFVHNSSVLLNSLSCFNIYGVRFNLLLMHYLCFVLQSFTDVL